MSKLKLSRGFYYAVLALLVLFVLMFFAVHWGCAEMERDCIKNARTKGAVELKCEDVEVKKLGLDVLVTGCKRNVTYTCLGSTPTK